MKIHYKFAEQTDLLARKGIVEISGELIQGAPEGVTCILKDFLVLEAKHCPELNIYRFVGAHPDFDILKENEEIPFYRFIFENIEKSKTEVIFEIRIKRL